ncbi:hypothetical protein KP509_14G086300 [Ceratopteris richardii]|uniref:Uncharacterized protein n=1 Tax=Ceratopteris richardii TaxID=49495 RepID=A0A8T2TBN4_CERRI|nr:hypothetical protein KP509_14G086300 [Ceratopteris richardii]
MYGHVDPTAPHDIINGTSDGDEDDGVERDALEEEADGGREAEDGNEVEDEAEDEDGAVDAAAPGHRGEDDDPYFRRGYQEEAFFCLRSAYLLPVICSRSMAYL